VGEPEASPPSPTPPFAPHTKVWVVSERSERTMSAKWGTASVGPEARIDNVRST